MMQGLKTAHDLLPVSLVKRVGQATMKWLNLVLIDLSKNKAQLTNWALLIF